jgi:hypothetical protein
LAIQTSRMSAFVPALRRIHAGLESARSDHRVSGVIQDRWTGATGNVRPQADMHALLEDFAQWKHRIREINVGERAMGNAGATRTDQCDIVVADKVAMGKDGTPGQQPESVQRRGVRATIAIQHKTVLPVALGAMCLDVTPCLACQRPQPG